MKGLFVLDNFFFVEGSDFFLGITELSENILVVSTVGGSAAENLTGIVLEEGNCIDTHDVLVVIVPCGEGAAGLIMRPSFASIVMRVGVMPRFAEASFVEIYSIQIFVFHIMIK